MSDIVCTSANAKKIVDSFPEDEKLIFAPDKNLGNYINSITGRSMVLWDGACMVHEQYSVEKIIDLMDKNPDAEFIAHPECEKTGTTAGKTHRVNYCPAELRTKQRCEEIYCSHRKRYSAPDDQSLSG